MVVAPDARAAEAGASILREGGSAIEAAIAAMATLCVVYPHMTGLGGDAFWLVKRPGASPQAVMGAGHAGVRVTPELYAGYQAIPTRGPLAANTVAGGPSTWAAALALPGASRLPRIRLVAEAVRLAADGATVARSLAQTLQARAHELRNLPGWADAFLPGGSVPGQGDVLRLPVMARTFSRLAADGFDALNREGEILSDVVDDLAEAGSPLLEEDFLAFAAREEKPLSVRLSDCTVYNTPPPTQGAASLLILALADRLARLDADSVEGVHAIVEATKLAFLHRDSQIGDPAGMTDSVQALLDDAAMLDAMAARIDLGRAASWPRSGPPGDTVWVGVADADGCLVSLIQSIYHEFGSGVVLRRTGITWQNRGASFQLGSNGSNALRPRRSPLHTLNPALALFDDGRMMAYGAMGGEGQPQTQAAIFARIARQQKGVAEAVAGPRWLLGRTWGEEVTALRVEQPTAPDVIAALAAAGHDVRVTEPLSETMGHAGAILRHPDGRLDGASDPRCDGAAAWA
jgi:gamma-glutamyltranspeptidase/glutathione hydrolase